MPISRYGGITGSKKISEDFDNINTAFNNVATEADADKSTVDTHIANINIHTTAAEKAKLAGIATSAGTPSSASDTVIGNRTIADTTAPADTGTLTGLLSGLANMIKQITGGATWRTAPGMTIVAIKALFDAATNAATFSTIMKRDAAGRAKVAAPSADDDIAIKSTVDAVQANLTTHRDDTTVHLTTAERTVWNNKVDKVTGKQLSTEDYTTAEKTKLGGITAGAEVNQNTFGIVAVPGQINVIADAKSDILNLVPGTGITITTNPDTDTVTVTATGAATPGAHATSHLTGGSDPIPVATTTTNGFMAATDKTILNNNTGFGTTAGSSTAYTITLSPAPTLVTGMKFSFIAHVASGANPTLNANGLGAKPIRKPNGLAAKLTLNGVYTVVYDGTAFILQGEGGEYGTATAADVLEGTTFGTESGVVPGTIVDLANLDVDGYISTAGPGYLGVVGNEDINGNVGYFRDSTTIIVNDASLIPANFLAGRTVLSIVGTATSDATAVAANLLSGKSAYINGVKVTGTMPEITVGADPATGVGQWPDGGLAIYPSEGYRKGGSGAGEIKVSPAQLQAAYPTLLPSNVRNGVPLAGVTGTLVERVTWFNKNVSFPNTGSAFSPHWDFTITGITRKPIMYMVQMNIADFSLFTATGTNNVMSEQSTSGIWNGSSYTLSSTSVKSTLTTSNYQYLMCTTTYDATAQTMRFYIYYNNGVLSFRPTDIRNQDFAVFMVY